VLKTFVGFANQARGQRTPYGMEKHGASEPAADSGESNWKKNHDGEDAVEPLHTH